MAVQREDPYAAFNYLVEIGGIAAGGFNEVSGLDAEIEPIDYRNGDEDFVNRKLPGLKKFPNIVLKRGIVGNLDAELFLEGHHELDRIKAVGSQIVDEACALDDLVGVDAKVLDHNVFDAFCGVAHI